MKEMELVFSAKEVSSAKTNKHLNITYETLKERLDEEFLLSNEVHIGGTAPTKTQDMIWADSTNGNIKIYDSNTKKWKLVGSSKADDIGAVKKIGDTMTGKLNITNNTVNPTLDTITNFTEVANIPSGLGISSQNRGTDNGYNVGKLVGVNVKKDGKALELIAGVEDSYLGFKVGEDGKAWSSTRQIVHQGNADELGILTQKQEVEVSKASVEGDTLTSAKIGITDDGDVYLKSTSKWREDPEVEIGRVQIGRFGGLSDGTNKIITNKDYEVGEDGFLKDISGEDIKSIVKSGKYWGDGCINQPPKGSGRFIYDIEIADRVMRRITAKDMRLGTIYTLINDLGWEEWEKVYTDKNKPIPSDIGALATTGGNLTGNLVVKKDNPRIVASNLEGNNKAIMQPSSTQGSFVFGGTTDVNGNEVQSYVRVGANELLYKGSLGTKNILHDGNYMVGSNGVLKDISNQDLKTINVSGRYMGASCVNAPAKGWYFYDIEVHSANFKKITARHIGSEAIYQLSCDSGIWSNSWEEILTKSSLGTASGFLPITGGSINGSLEVSETIKAQAVIPSGYLTTDSDASFQGKWTKVASFKLTYRFQELSTKIDFMGTGSGGRLATSGQLLIKIKQQETLGTAPYWSFHISNYTVVTPDNFKLILTSNTSTLTECQLWYKASQTYEVVKFAPIAIPGSNGCSFLSKQGYQDSLPTGNSISPSKILNYDASDVNAVPANGGNISGNINFTTGNKGLSQAGSLYLRNNGTATVLSAVNDNIHLRPSGDGTSTNETTLTPAGLFTVNGSNTGNGIVVNGNGRYVKMYVPNSTYAWIDTNSTSGLFINKDLSVNGNIFIGSTSTAKKVWHDGNWAGGRPGAANRSASGYEKLPSGFIIQWGIACMDIPPGGQCNATITYPITFPNCAVTAHANANWNRHTGSIDYLDQIITNANMVGDNGKSQLRIVAKNLKEALVPVTESFEISWFAIGY